jgi:hypothetical protein
MHDKTCYGKLAQKSTRPRRRVPWQQVRCPRRERSSPRRAPAMADSDLARDCPWPRPFWIRRGPGARPGFSRGPGGFGPGQGLSLGTAFLDTARPWRAARIPPPDIHRLLPRHRQTPWKCGQFAVRKMRAFRGGGPCVPPAARGSLFLHRARSASRPKQFARAVGGSRTFPGVVDESATGSVNFFGPARVREPLEHGARTPNSCCAQGSLRKLRASRLRPPCTGRGRALGFLLHRARSASRSKQFPRAVGGSRRFTGDVDKSATGSVNFFWSNPPPHLRRSDRRSRRTALTSPR